MLKDIRDGFRGGVIRPNNRPNGDDNDDEEEEEDKIEEEKKYAGMPDLETEEDAAKRIADSYEQKKDKINKFKNNMEAEMDNFDKNLHTKKMKFMIN